MEDGQNLNALMLRKLVRFDKSGLDNNKSQHTYANTILHDVANVGPRLRDEQ